ncbi:hypothetical protein [Pseudomonas sp. UMAB-40]|uniref:hypothetical protein n=1 Tax=Pseudomonas sp. UMAB-40 TaxID=1365407 RepID=UPI001C59C3E3|nr:hypothetical protein [Pseudomonas sp. UMAB-40]
MNPVPALTPHKLLVVSAVVELATGAALLLTPGLVCNLLLGMTATDATDLVARCFGIALIALGIACWPKAANPAALRSMLFYNGAIALYLAYVGVLVGGGLLLWPAVVFHAVMTALFLRR